MTALPGAWWMSAGRDSGAVRVVAVVRVLAVLSVAAIGSFTGPSHGPFARFLLVLGLAGVPWSTIVFFCADRPDNRIAVYGGPVGDLLLLFAAQSLLKSAVEPVLLGYLVLVAFTVYTAGRSFAAMVVAAAIGLTVIAHSVAPGNPQLRASVTIPVFVGAAALVPLVERTTALQARAAAASDRLRTRADIILSHVADAVFVTDDAGRILLCNPATERLLGLPASAITGSACDAVLGLHVGERALDCSKRCGLLTLRATASQDLWRQSPTGRRQPLLAEAADTPGVDGGAEVVHSVRDITRLKQAEEAKTLFLATASHELKTPLTVISGFASTLLRYPDLTDEMRTSAYEAISTRSAELTRIVERLLLSSRIEAGKLDVRLERIEIGPLLRERVDGYAASMQRLLTLNAGEQLPAVIANGGALTTVIDHLLDNAIKYSPGGEPIAVGVADRDHLVEITVADQGVGMDADQAAHCFDRFWQAESTDIRRFGGTGIGLYIVQSLVEAMSGSVTVESSPGAGSTFMVQLRKADAVPRQTVPRKDGESTSIREFMRQIGVPERNRR
jgi:PAS domain S-box-containing protein